MTAQLTQTEIDERVAILHRLRNLLEQQRRKFFDYLHVLEKQESVIKIENGDALIEQTELEQNIVAGIANLQRVIEPIENLYKETNPQNDLHLFSLKNDLHKIKQKVLIQNEKNRSLLKTHMESIRSQITSIKNPYTNRQSVYASQAHSASVIDVTG